MMNEVCFPQLKYRPYQYYLGFLADFFGDHVEVLKTKHRKMRPSLIEKYGFDK